MSRSIDMFRVGSLTRWLSPYPNTLGTLTVFLAHDEDKHETLVVRVVSERVSRRHVGLAIDETHSFIIVGVVFDSYFVSEGEVRA